MARTPSSAPVPAGLQRRSRLTRIPFPLKISPCTQVNGVEASAGWLITPGVMLEGEYVTQKYQSVLATDQRSGGQFGGYVCEGVVSFRECR